MNSMPPICSLRPHEILHGHAGDIAACGAKVRGPQAVGAFAHHTAVWLMPTACFELLAINVDFRSISCAPTRASSPSHGEWA
jgi:hypothetical protein